MIFSALGSSNTLRLEEVLLFDAIKELKTSSKEVFELLELVIQADMKKFSNDLKKYKQLLEKNNIEESEMLEKKQYLTLCSLDLAAKNTFTFQEFASMLNLNQDEVDEWVINAVTGDIIDAKLDQIQETIQINSHKLAKISEEEWKAL